MEEFKMNNDYEIKMDGKEHKFGEATRFTKDGKGRFDLIPEDVIIHILNHIPDQICNDDGNIITCMEEPIEYAYNGDYVNAILSMINLQYASTEDRLDCCVSTQYDVFVTSLFPKTLHELAIHFQKGAEKYGERNCEKGIPLWSFRDSGLRHMGQWFMGCDDENHFIAAIWNFVMAIWTIKNHPERCSDKTEDDKPNNENKRSDDTTDKVKVHVKRKDIDKSQTNVNYIKKLSNVVLKTIADVNETFHKLHEENIQGITYENVLETESYAIELIKELRYCDSHIRQMFFKHINDGIRPVSDTHDEETK